jgi:hypothetical protein
VKAVSIVHEDRLSFNRLWLDCYTSVAGNDDLNSYVSQGMKWKGILSENLPCYSFSCSLQNDKGHNPTNGRTDNHVAAFIILD